MNHTHGSPIEAFGDDAMVFLIHYYKCHPVNIDDGKVRNKPIFANTAVDFLHILCTNTHVICRLLYGSLSSYSVRLARYSYGYNPNNQKRKIGAALTQ